MKHKIIIFTMAVIVFFVCGLVFMQDKGLAEDYTPAKNIPPPEEQLAEIQAQTKAVLEGANPRGYFKRLTTELTTISGDGNPISAELHNAFGALLTAIGKRGVNVASLRETLSSIKSFTEMGAFGGPSFAPQDGPTKLGITPVAIENIDFILPMGAVSDSHVVPVDHQYWYLVNAESNNQQFEVRAPADGVIVKIGLITKDVVDNPVHRTKNFVPDYDVGIEHSPTLSTYMIHIDTLRPDILAQIDYKELTFAQNHSPDMGIPVKEGEVIGTVSGIKFDFSVHDGTFLLPGFVFPEHYSYVGHRAHTVDVFENFDELISTQLKDKTRRAVEPVGGKIDYDIEGRLIGTWFKENTDWYKGINEKRYWDGHLAIVPNYIFPDLINISLGNYKGMAAQFCVKGNSPDPANIGIANGPVKYELVGYYDQVETFDPRAHPELREKMAGKEVFGVMLFEVLPDNKLRMEVFPDMTADQVSGFTPSARMYER